MNKSGCCFLVFAFLLFVATDVILFIWFLGRFKPTETSATTTDMIPIKKDFSTFWCEGITLKSSLDFNAFQLKSEPVIQDKNLKTYSNDFVKKLSRYESVLYEFYLLKGSSLKVSLCSSERWAYVSLFKRKEAAQKCIDDKVPKLGESYDEDYILNYVACSDTFLTGGVMVNRDCENNGWRWGFGRRKGMDVVNVNVHESGYYYVLVKNFYPYSLNKIQMEINVTRTLYDVRQSNHECIGTKLCYFSFDFMSDDKIIAQMLPSESSEKFVGTMVHSYCNLSELIIFSVFVVTPLLLFFIICCVACCLCRNDKYKKIEKKKKKKKVEKQHLLSCVDECEEDHTLYERRQGYGTNPAPGYNTTPQQGQVNPNYYQPPPQYNAPPQYGGPPQYAANPNLPRYPPTQNQTPEAPPYTA